MSVASATRPAGTGPFVDTEFALPALGAALWRRKWQVLRPTIVVALIAIAVVELIPPKYLSESRVLIESRGNVFLRPDVDKDINDRSAVDQEAVTSQAQLILSRDLAREVIAKLKLGELAEFNPAIKGISPIKKALAFLGIVRNPMRMTAEERVLEAYYDRLTVFPVEKSRVIVIDFLSQDPELAARVANAIAHAYLVRQQAAKQEQARAAGQWLAGEIQSMRKRVADAEAKVEAFRGDSNLLVGPNNTTLSAQQLGDLNAQLAAARVLKADAAAKAQLIREMLHSGGPIESSDILNSELIRRLSEQRVTLRAQLAEQSSTLLGGHPRIKELKAQIADLDKQIRVEAGIIARALENDAKLADARMESLTASLDQAKRQAAGTNERDVELRALQRDAKSQRDLLESYLAKYREATARETMNAAPADARVISRAAASNVPAYPKKLPTVLIVTLAAFVLFSGLALTRELLTVPAVAVAIENPIAAPVAAAAPVAPDRSAERASTAGPAAVVNEMPAPPAAPQQEQRLEAAAAAATLQPLDVPLSAIEDVAGDSRFAETKGVNEAAGYGSRLAVLAAAGGLNSGATATKLARAFAAAGGQVVLVGLGSADAAIKAISIDPAASGLAEFAAGAASFRDIITRDKCSSLNLITSGRAPVDRATILFLPSMATCFAALARSYDHLVIDAGVVGGPEMEVLAGIAPHAMLVVDLLASAVATAAHEQLVSAGFEDVTVLVGARPGTSAPKVAAA